MSSTLPIRVVSKTSNVPASPSNIDHWIVPVGSAGVWAGQDNKIAWFENGVWKFSSPSNGMQVWVADTNEITFWNGTSWSSISGSGSGTISRGIIRARRDTPQSIPNNVSPYPAHTYQMTTISFRSNNDWTLNASGEIVIPAGVNSILAVASIYWGDNVPNTQYTMNFKRNEVHFSGEYWYLGGALMISATGMTNVSEGDRIAIGLRQGTGAARSPSWGEVCVAAIG